MDQTQPLQLARSVRPDLRLAPARPQYHQGQAGTSTGINLAPGSNDDGWVVPQPVELSDGTRIQLFKDGEALRAAYEAIRAARHLICLEVYIFASDATGQAFAELLCAKARAGVRVYIIYDAFGSMGVDPAMFQRLSRAGCNVQAFHPVWPWECLYGWRPVNRDHRKLLVIDSSIAGMGGLNIGAEYAGSWVVGASAHQAPGDAWRDNAIAIIGPCSRYLRESFAKSWHYVTHGGRSRTAELVHNLDGGGDFGLLASTPTMASPLAPMFRTLIHESRRSVQMTMAYFAPGDDLIAELCRAARRGVRVQLMLPSRSDVKLMRLAARSFYETLLSAGVEVYERQHAVLHAKTMVVDAQTTVIGSANLDYQSIQYNLELTALVRSEQLGRQMHELFQNDVRFAHQIYLGEWRRRPTLDRMVQWAVKRARYLL